MYKNLTIMLVLMALFLTGNSLSRAQDDASVSRVEIPDNADLPEITIGELEDHLEFLASDRLKGRYPGTEEDKLTAIYIASELKQAGLSLLDADGLQTFDVITKIEAGDSNQFVHQGQDQEINQEFAPFPFTANGGGTADVVFAGFGFEFDTDSLSWHDYQGLNVEGKWALILRGNPDPENLRSVYVNHSEDRGKAMLARDRGALGCLLVSGKKVDPADNLVSLKSRQHSVGIPVIHIKRSLADCPLETA